MDVCRKKNLADLVDGAWFGNTSLEDGQGGGKGPEGWRWENIGQIIPKKQIEEWNDQPGSCVGRPSLWVFRLGHRGCSVTQSGMRE